MPPDPSHPPPSRQPPRRLLRAWLALGELLRRVVSPLLLGLIYFGLLTPIALLARLCGHDPLRLRRDRRVSSHWIERDPPGPDPATMERQY